jgi:5-methylthioadenosine/S-adenosylhomocysteine deaminase
LSSNQSCFNRLAERKTTLIDNARILLSSRGPIEGVSILVSDRRIVAIGDRTEIRRNHGSWEEKIDASDCLAIPGFVNNHSHIAMALLRGLAEDLPLLNWLRDKIWPIEEKLKPWQIEIGAALGASESLLSGTTCVTSTYFYDSGGSEASAIEKTGLRAWIGHGIFDWAEEKGLRATKDLVAHFHGKDKGRIRIATAPHSSYSCSPELLKKIEALRESLSEKFGAQYPILNTIHVAEARTEAHEIKNRYGEDASHGILNYLHSLGVLNSDTICAHCIHLSDDDYIALSETGASIASCPISNLKVGCGVADLPRIISHGIVLSLGTDGPASNNSLDMFETTKIASLLAKGLTGDTTHMSSKVSFGIATEGGAKSLHQEREFGALFKGAKADIVLLDLSRISAMPFHDPYNYILYSARSSNVRDVLVDGRIVVRGGELLSVNLENLRGRISAAVSEIATTSNLKR